MGFPHTYSHTHFGSASTNTQQQQQPVAHLGTGRTHPNGWQAKSSPADPPSLGWGAPLPAAVALLDMPRAAPAGFGGLGLCS